MFIPPKPFFNCAFFYRYITFLYKSQMFLRIFKVWNSISVTYSRKDKTLRRDISLIACCTLTSAVLENMVLHLEYVKELDTINGKQVASI